MNYDDAMELSLMKTGHRIEIFGANLFERYFSILSIIQEEHEDYKEKEECEKLVQSFPCPGSNFKQNDSSDEEDEVEDYDFSDTLNDYALLEPPISSKFWKYIENVPYDICKNSILYEEEITNVPIEEKNVKPQKRRGRRKRGRKKTPAKIPAPVVEVKTIEDEGKTHFLPDSIMLGKDVLFYIAKWDPKDWNCMSKYFTDGFQKKNFIKSLKTLESFCVSDMPFSMITSDQYGFTEFSCEMNGIQRDFLTRNRLSDDPIIYSAILAEFEMKKSERLSHWEALLKRMDHYHMHKKTLKKKKQPLLKGNQLSFTREVIISSKKQAKKLLKVLKKAQKNNKTNKVLLV